MDYSTDKPIEESAQDRYSRKEYAKRLADTLVDSSQKNDFVIGIYSKWGYGKSSVLTMVKEYIADEALVIPFNPWIFENQTAIVTALLFNLAEKIDGIQSKQEEIKKGKIRSKIDGLVNKQTKHGALNKGETASKLIKKYSGLVGIGLNFATGNDLAGKGSNAVFELAESYLKTSSIEEIKAKIEKKIEQAGKKVIIVIDDLDRLDKDEIFQLLKIIKIIADFKGVTYLVAFDDGAVAAAISHRFSANESEDSGRLFLEKIIQVPLHLPAIPQTLLNSELFTGIDALLVENNIEIKDEEVSDFRFVFDDYIAPSINSPRAVARFLNSLKFTLPFVGKEVNISDFLVVEALRIFHPNEYEKIRHEKIILTGVSDRFSFSINDEDGDAFTSNAQRITSSKSEVLEIVKLLFPSFRKRLENGNSASSLRELTKEKRVASPDYFDRYFSYGVVNDDVSDTEIISLLKQEDWQSIANSLRKILKYKSQELTLKKIDAYFSATAKPIELAKALISLGNDLEVGEGGFNSSPISMAAEIIEATIVESTDKLAFSKQLLDFITDPTMLFYVIREVNLNSRQESQNRLLDDSQLANFKVAAVDKIKATDKQLNILGVDSDVAYYLYDYWSEFGNQKEAEKALKSRLKNENDVLNYIILHLSKISGGGRRYRGNFNAGTYSNINKTISMSYLVKILVASYPDLAKKPEFKDVEHAEGDIGKVGNEKKPEFRRIIVEQVFYQHEQSNKESENTTN